MMSRGDTLMGRVLAGENGAAANDLLSEFVCGYPLDRLRLLLQSKNDDAVRTGAFIASELGRQFAPLIDEAASMLDHPIASVRFDALDVILVVATTEHADLLARAIRLISDSDKSVRWKAMRFLRRATIEQLNAALAYLDEDALKVRAGWIVDAERKVFSADEIGKKLRAANRLDRVFASVAAARLSLRGSTRLLEIAAASADDEVSSFARDELELLQPRQR
jgi:hypothetical protein